MKLLTSIRTSLRDRADRKAAKKAETARHRVEAVTEVVAIAVRREPEQVTVVLSKYVRVVHDIKIVVADLHKDRIKLERRAMTCAYNNPFTYVNRLTNESFEISSYSQAEVHIRELTHTIRVMHDTINAFEPHPDYRMMRRTAKARAKAAA